MVAGHINRLDAGDVFDIGDIGGMHDREDLRQPGIHAGAVERRVAADTRGLQNLGLRGAAAVVGVAVVPGDPVGGGDDVDAGLEHSLVQLHVRPNPVERQAIRTGGQDVVDAAGRADADRADADDVAGVATDLVR